MVVIIVTRDVQELQNCRCVVNCFASLSYDFRNYKFLLVKFRALGSVSRVQIIILISLYKIKNSTGRAHQCRNLKENSTINGPNAWRIWNMDVFKLRFSHAFFVITNQTLSAGYRLFIRIWRSLKTLLACAHFSTSILTYGSTISNQKSQVTSASISSTSNVYPN